MSMIVTWLLNSQVGRWVAGAAGVLLLALIIAWKIFTAGKNSQKAVQAKANLEAYRTREKVNAEINSKTEAELDGYLSSHVTGRVRDRRK